MHFLTHHYLINRSKDPDLLKEGNIIFTHSPVQRSDIRLINMLIDPYKIILGSVTKIRVRRGRKFKDEQKTMKKIE